MKAILNICLCIYCVISALILDRTLDGISENHRILYGFCLMIGAIIAAIIGLLLYGIIGVCFFCGT